MKTKRKFLDPTLQSRGNYDAPPGSEAWATAVRSEIQAALEDHTRSVKDLEAWIKAIQHRKGWEVLYDAKGRHFETYEQFAREKPPWGLGREPGEVDIIIQIRKTAQAHGLTAAPPAKNGRPLKGVGPTPLLKGGSADRLAARIARDRPDILDAGISEKRFKMPINPERAARIIKKHFNEDQILELIALLLGAKQ
jgi:hypothetical protein